MKLKRLIQIAIVGCSILALAACSSSKKNAGMNGPDGGMMGPDGAQATGIGEEDNFGGGSGNAAGSMSQKQLLQKRTYYFDYDSNMVHEDDKAAIYANANYLIAHPEANIIIEGHTDPRGSREYNVALGERRANAVSELLQSKGVSANQIRVVSYGAERLAVAGHSEQDMQLDRRAVIVVQ